MLVDSQKEKHDAVHTALPGRDESITGFEPHAVLGTPIEPPYPPHYEKAMFGMGCFWGAERKFWQLNGVHTTSVGYGGGYTANPSYQDVCSGKTGHTELVRVVFFPAIISLQQVLQTFWESHDPTCRPV